MHHGHSHAKVDQVVEQTRWVHKTVLNQVEFNKKQKLKTRKLCNQAEQVIKELAEEATNNDIKFKD